jgi:hypothetical protein
VLLDLSMKLFYLALQKCKLVGHQSPLRILASFLAQPALLLAKPSLLVA